MAQQSHHSDPAGQWWNPLPSLSKTADKEAARLNFVWRQIIDPCDAPFTVWIWCFWPAFKKLLIAWFALDLKQIFRTMLRPKYRALSVRSRRHLGGGEKGKRGRGKRIKLNPFSYDPNDVIGGTLNPYDGHPGFGPAPGELWFWSALEIFERVAYYWMVLDLGTDFLYNWASGVSETKYCHARDDAVLTASNPGYPLLGIFGWDAVGTLDAEKQRKVLFFNGFGAALEFGPGAALLTFSFANTDGQPGAWIECRLRCLNGPRIDYSNTLRDDCGPFGSGTCAVHVDISGAETWMGEIRVNGSFDIEQPTLNMHAVFHPDPI
jgi:hypothetical protein